MTTNNPTVREILKKYRSDSKWAGTRGFEIKDQEHADRLATQQIEELVERDYVERESLEYHEQEAMKLKASLADRNIVEVIAMKTTPGNLASRLAYHQSMIAQLKEQSKPTKEEFIKTWNNLAEHKTNVPLIETKEEQTDE